MLRKMFLKGSFSASISCSSRQLVVAADLLRITQRFTRFLETMASKPSTRQMSTIFLVFVVCCGLFLTVKGGEEPMVAFTCNLPAMHLTEHGWARDEATDCLTQPQQILDYCKRMYPELEISNIVESGSRVKISDWCPVGRSHCHHHSFTVRPYRCLIGSFQSDALLVPRNCLFDHIHDPRTCQSYDDWNQSSVAACRGRGLKQHSFAIIQPCSVDRFSGAEFVCCPVSDHDQAQPSHSHKDQFKKHKHGKDEVLEPWTPPTEKPSTDHIPREIKSSNNQVAREVKRREFKDLIGGKEDVEVDQRMDREIEERWGGDRVDGAYVRYMREGVAIGDIDKNSSEHDSYRDAKLDLEKRHHQKISKMMKEWNSAHQRVEEMMSVDSKGADKLNKQITARFQKMYDSLEEEEEAETKRLAALHHQRVQAELNQLKRTAMEAYMGSLAESKPNSARILRALKRYLKLEQKDRVHMITHYQSTQKSDPVQADSIFSYVADHLTVIDQRIAQALDMLHGLSEYQQRKIRSHIDDFMSGFHSMDESLAVILAKMAERGSSTATTGVTSTTPRISSTSPASAQTTRLPTTRQAETTALPTTHTTTSSKPTVGDKRFDRFDDGVMESHDDYIEIKPASGHVNHIDNSQLNVGQMSSLRASRTDTSGMYLATPLGIAVCSLALILIISVGIVVMRRRAASSGDGEVARAAGLDYRCSERPGGLPRQMNGYENPTHRYIVEQRRDQSKEQHSVQGLEKLEHELNHEQLERELEEAIEDEHQEECVRE